MDTVVHEDEGVDVDDHAEEAAEAAAARDAAETRSPSRQRCRRVLQIRLKTVALIAMCN